MVKILGKNKKYSADETINKLNRIDNVLTKKETELSRAKTWLKEALVKSDEARLELFREKNKIQAVLKSIKDGLIVFDEKKIISFINPQAEQIFNVNHLDIVGCGVGDLKKHSELESFLRLVAEKALSDPTAEFEFDLKEPKERFFQAVVAPVAEQGGISIGEVITIHDITREKNIEKMKSEFVSLAAHQLRTPLSAVKWILKMLINGDIGKLSAPQIEFLNKGYESNERMICLINDLLNVVSIEGGRFIHFFSLEFLDNLVEKIVQSRQRAIKEKKIDLEIKKIREKFPKIKINKEKIELVIQNLLDNAINYSVENSKIEIILDYDETNARFEIEDSGIGISEKEQERLFTKFFRSQKAVQMRTEGTGLGLFICKNIIEAHNGRIGFSSKEGQGSIFWFTIPIQNILP